MKRNIITENSDIIINCSASVDQINLLKDWKIQIINRKNTFKD